MRKILLSAVLCLTGACTFVSAQNRLADADTRLLDECRTVFTQGDYGAAGSLLDEWVKLTENRKQDPRCSFHRQ